MPPDSRYGHQRRSIRKSPSNSPRVPCRLHDPIQHGKIRDTRSNHREKHSICDSVLIGTQLRHYVDRRITENTSRTSAPRNMMPEIARHLHCNEFAIKKHMLWSRIAGLMPSLVVNGNNLFDWIFASDSAVRYQCHENAILERTISAANNQTEGSMIRYTMSE